jgi:hypothetical protein
MVHLFMTPTTDQIWPEAPLDEPSEAATEPLLLAFRAESLATLADPAPPPPVNRLGYNHFGIND